MYRHWVCQLYSSTNWRHFPLGYHQIPRNSCLSVCFSRCLLIHLLQLPLPCPCLSFSSTTPPTQAQPFLSTQLLDSRGETGDGHFPRLLRSTFSESWELLSIRQMHVLSSRMSTLWCDCIHVGLYLCTHMCLTESTM